VKAEIMVREQIMLHVLKRCPAIKCF